MKTLIIYTHPNPVSFCHAIKEVIENALLSQSHEVRVKDLYAEKFDPVLSSNDLMQIATGSYPEEIIREQQQVKWADSLIFIYPIWWYDRPALLKGWIDRVFSRGFAFDYTSQGPIGLLKHRKALVIQTVGSSEHYFKDRDAEQVIHRAMTEGTLEFSGIRQVKSFYSVPGVSHAARLGMLKEAAQLVNHW